MRLVKVAAGIVVMLIALGSLIWSSVGGSDLPTGPVAPKPVPHRGPT